MADYYTCIKCDKKYYSKGIFFCTLCKKKPMCGKCFEFQCNDCGGVICDKCYKKETYECVCCQEGFCSDCCENCCSCDLAVCKNCSVDCEKCDKVICKNCTKKICGDCFKYKCY